VKERTEPHRLAAALLVHPRSPPEVTGSAYRVVVSAYRTAEEPLAALGRPRKNALRVKNRHPGRSEAKSRDQKPLKYRNSCFRGNDNKGISMPFSQLSVGFFRNLLGAGPVALAVVVVLDGPPYRPGK
jgi:hypothetical protein